MQVSAFWGEKSHGKHDSCQNSEQVFVKLGRAGDKLKRRQELPPEAFFSVDELKQQLENCKSWPRGLGSTQLCEGNELQLKQLLGCGDVRCFVWSGAGLCLFLVVGGTAGAGVNFMAVSYCQVVSLNKRM